jgi:hypothetical protein
VVPVAGVCDCNPRLLADAGAAAWVLAAAVQIVALLARSEAWQLTIREAGGTVDPRVLYRASSMGVLGGLLNAQAAVAARIAALRRSSPDVSPRVPTLVAAEGRFLVGAPLVWAVLLLFHPGGEGCTTSHSLGMVQGGGWRGEVGGCGAGRVAGSNPVAHAPFGRLLAAL